MLFWLWPHRVRCAWITSTCVAQLYELRCVETEQPTSVSKKVSVHTDACVVQGTSTVPHGLACCVLWKSSPRDNHQGAVQSKREPLLMTSKVRKVWIGDKVACETGKAQQMLRKSLDTRYWRRGKNEGQGGAEGQRCGGEAIIKAAQIFNHFTN